MKDDSLVMCLTNTVAANFTANVLLAIGAKPAMVEDRREAVELAKIADATLVNVGTLTDAQAEVMLGAVESCNASGRRWVLDPVAVHLLTFRRQFVKRLLALRPAIVRGNHEEISFIRDLGVADMVMLSTGATDEIVYPGGNLKISGGVEMLQSVTATGCAQGAICAAHLGCGMAPMEAAEASSRLLKRAGEMAWEKAKEPGSFQVALLDALHELS